VLAGEDAGLIAARSYTEAVVAQQVVAVPPPLGGPGHIASHSSLAVLVVGVDPAEAEVVAVLRFPLFRSIKYMHYAWNIFTFVLTIFWVYYCFSSIPYK